MKTIITLYDINNLEKLSKYTDGFIISNKKFAARLTKSFEIEEINEIIDKCLDLNKEVFLNVNQMFTDDQIIDFINNFKKINYNNLTGIIVADIGTIVALGELGLNSKTIYNPETLLTNTIDFNFLKRLNVYGAYLAKEITIEDILTISKNKEHKTFMVGHGHLNMFYSKRKLLDNYQELIDGETSYEEMQNLKIIEPNRSKTPYPLLQDSAGTHVFRSKVMNSFKYLGELKENIDYFIIDTIFKDDNYGLLISKLYKQEKQDEQEFIEIQKTYQEEWDNGFLNNKTYYKR